MAQARLDGLDVRARGDEQAGEVMPQIVIEETRRETLHLLAGFPHRPLYRPW
jgi:hypothetical protein